MTVFVGAEELGRILGIGENSLLAMARERRIPAIVIGRRVLFHPDDVADVLRSEGLALVQDGRRDEGVGLGERTPLATPPLSTDRPSRGVPRRVPLRRNGCQNGCQGVA